MWPQGPSSFLNTQLPGDACGEAGISREGPAGVRGRVWGQPCCGAPLPPRGVSQARTYAELCVCTWCVFPPRSLRVPVCEDHGGLGHHGSRAPGAELGSSGPSHGLLAMGPDGAGGCARCSGLVLSQEGASFSFLQTLGPWSRAACRWGGGADLVLRAEFPWRERPVPRGR